MKVAVGASHDRRAAAGLALMLVLAGLAVTGMLLLPSLASKTTQRRNTTEEAALARLEECFRDYVRLYQIIPGTGTWSTAIASISGMSTAQVSSVFPEFPTDPSVQRVFVVDDYLGGGTPLLPYTQSTDGLTGTLTNLLNNRARAMIVSSTKRGLALPISSGFLTQANFDAIWDWTYNPATEAPPSGWSSAWTGNGEFLHVKPLYLPSLFSKITLQNAKYGLGLVNLVTTTVNGQTDYYFLNGAPMTLSTALGKLKHHHVVRGDASFDLTESDLDPVLWFKFSESTGSIATNNGSYSTDGNGIFTNGVLLAQAGPRFPTFPNFTSDNTAAYFDGVTSYVETGRLLTNELPAFTLAAWVRPNQFPTNASTFLGVRGALALETKSLSGLNYVQVATKNGGTAAALYPYSSNAWHHVAAVGNGLGVTLYLDGVLAATTLDACTNYFYDSGGTFRVGANATTATTTITTNVTVTFWLIFTVTKRTVTTTVVSTSGSSSSSSTSSSSSVVGWVGTIGTTTTSTSSSVVTWDSPVYKGHVDNAVVYHRALSITEILSLAAGLSP